MNPLINIIIPTRERAETLYWTILSCLEQDYENFRIVVSDNCSEDETEKIVKKIKSDKVTYIRTPQRVSMSENWEFALEQISEGFVCYLGDDDGLVQNSLSKLVEIISKTNKLAYRTPNITHYWPDICDENIAGSIGNLPIRDDYEIIDCQSFQRAVFEKLEFYHPYFLDLPTVYQSFVNFELLKKIREKNNKFFLSSFPDLYSAVAISSEIDEYVLVHRPVTINAMGKFSNGVANKNFFNEKSKEVKRFFVENKYQFDERLVEKGKILTRSLTHPIIIADQFIKVRRHNKNIPEIDFKNVIKRSTECLWRKRPKEIYDSVIEDIRMVAEINNLESFAEEEIKKHPYVHIEPRKEPPLYVDEINRVLSIDSTKYGVKNILDTGRFINTLISQPEIKKLFSDKNDIPAHAFAIPQKTNKNTLFAQVNPNSAENFSQSQTNKLIIITEGFPALSETFILDQITGYIDNGVDVEIWTLRLMDQDKVHPSVIKYNLMKLVTEIKLPESNYSDISEWTNRFYQINEVSRTEDIGKIHVHYGTCFNSLAQLFYSDQNSKVIVSFHGYDASMFIKEAGDNCYNFLFQRANLITTPSQYMKNKLTCIGCFEEKIKIHRYGIDLDLFQNKYNVGKNRIIKLLSICRLVEKKGIEYAISAIIKLEKLKNIRYKIVGEGPLKNDLIGLINSLKLNDVIEIVPFVDRDGVIEEMLNADIFILPSITAQSGDQEGIPVSLTEAHAMGLPVISTYHSGIPELVEHGSTGLLSEEKDVEGIAKNLSELINNSSLRMELSKNARVKVESEFDIKKQNEKLLKYFFEKDKSVKAFTTVNPKISICIPTYNRANFIKYAINSALNQNYNNYEVIVVDDGSTDNTKEIVDSFSDTRIRYFYKPHTNTPATRNLCIDKASGEYILWLDSDDELYSGIIEDYLNTLNNYKDVQIVYCKLRAVDEKGNEKRVFEYEDYYNRTNDAYTFLFTGQPIPNGGTLVKKTIYDEVGKFNTEFKRAHDYEFYSRLFITQKYNLKYVDKFLYKYRIHDSNITLNTSGIIDLSYEVKILKSILDRCNYKDFFPKLDWKNHPQECEAMANLNIGIKFYQLGGFNQSENYFEKFIINDNSNQNFLELFNLLIKDQKYNLANSLLIKTINKITKYESFTEVKSALLTIGNLNENVHRNAEELANKDPIDIIFLTHNRLEYFKKTIESLKVNTRYPYRITVVDNASDNEVVEYLKEHENEFHKVIYNPQNEWTGAFQKGIDISTSDPFIVCDPDILVPDLKDKCWLEKMILLHKENEDLGLLAINLDKSNLPKKLPDVYLGPKEELNEEIVLSNVGTVMQSIKRKYFDGNYVTDWQTCENIKRKGGKVGFAKNIVGYHLGWNEEVDYPEHLIEKHKYFKTTYGADIYKEYISNNLIQEKLDKKELELEDKYIASVIVPIYNQVECTVGMILSLNKNTSVNYETILIDNNSDEETKSVLNKLSGYKNIKLIYNDVNEGFPKAVNQGIKKAEGKYIVIANSDIIFTKNWLYHLINHAEREKDIGIVGPISNEVSGMQLDKSAQYSTIEQMHEYSEKKIVEEKGNFFQFPRVAFLCTLIKKEVIDKIGGLDERFSPGNFEDDDFCLRTQLAGFKTVIAQDVFIHHYGSKSFKADGEENYNKRLKINRQKFISKWGKDPDQIWLKGEKFRERNLTFPLNENLFIENFERANILLQEEEYDLAKIYLEKSLNNFDKFDNRGIDKSKIEILLNKVRTLSND
ncbi:MAG: glycosyltransferase [Melioribacteraceae bacterium]|nr:glycosyltransferase [Melioribacteraceae bacterium]